MHLKTAGTSYLEALRAIAKIDPALFREIMAFAIERYPTDRASYHVSADLAKVPAPDSLSDADLAGILDQFDTRETLHVTFGSVLTTQVDGRPRFRDRFMQDAGGERGDPLRNRPRPHRAAREAVRSGRNELGASPRPTFRGELSEHE